MAFLSHAGISLRYDRAGGGPAVLLIHGWTCNRTFWERQVHALRDRFTVITVDLRGHGESSRPRTGYSIGSMAADLEQLVRALGVSRIAIVGWSMGGVVAQDLARRLGERVGTLALVCSTPGGFTDPETGALPEEAAGIKKAVADDFRTFVRGFTARFFKLGERSPLFAWAVGQTQRTPPHVAEACFDALMAADMRAHLGALRVPTAVLHGRHDTLIPLSHGEALAKGIPGARLVVFEESAHAPFLEEPDAFNAALVTLLGGDQPAAQAPPAAERPAAVTAPAGREAAGAKPAEPAAPKRAEKPAAKAPAKPAPKRPTKPAAKAAKAPAKPKRK